MESNILSLIHSAFYEHPVRAVLILLVPPLVAVLYSSWYVRRLETASRFVATQQYMRVSPDELDELDAYAGKRGRAEFVREALDAIRDQHGPDGVRYGHVVLLLKAIDDGYVPPEKWPSFLPPEGTSDPVYKSV